jgi:hypothetical protein
MTYSIVVVTYPYEYGLLSIQARSIAKFLNLQDISKIVIVDQGDGCNITSEYGVFQDKVEIISSSELTTETCEYGWIKQQLLKLLAIQRLDSEYTLILDCKNIFVKPYTPHPLFHLATIPDPMLDECYIKSLNYFDSNASRYPQGVTPFYMYNPSVKSMIECIDNREINWHRWMLNPPDKKYHTEFSLYYAWMCKNNLLDIHHNLTTDSPRGDGKSVISVHKNTWANFSQEQLEDILSYFSALGLVNNLHEGLNLTNTLRLA